MYRTYDLANQYSVGGQPPIPIGSGQWVPGGYTQQNGRWTAPQTQAPSGPVIDLGNPQTTTPSQSITNKQALAQTLHGSPMPSPSPASPSAPSSTPFQSTNMSVSGYVQDAIRSQLPAIQAIGDEAGRKAFAENFIRSLVPEIQRRGGTVGDIRNEKIQIDGQWRDLIQDISGSAANAQYIVPDEGGSGPMVGGLGLPNLIGGPTIGGYGLNSMIQGDPLSRINSALGNLTDSSRVNLDALIAQLGGR